MQQIRYLLSAAVVKTTGELLFPFFLLTTEEVNSNQREATAVPPLSHLEDVDSFVEPRKLRLGGLDAL